MEINFNCKKQSLPLKTNNSNKPNLADFDLNGKPENYKVQENVMK